MNRYSIRILMRILLLAAAGLFVSCSLDLSGAGSETTNEDGITGIVHHGDGSAAFASIVKLIPSDFNTSGNETLPASLIDTTDSKGNYSFSAISEGTYNLIIRDESTRTGSKIDNISYVKTDNALKVPATDLAPLGGIKISREYIAGDEETVLFIPGTDIASRTKEAEVIIGNVPRGVFPSMYMSTSGMTPVEIASSITVSSSDTLTINRPLWKHSKSVYINTTSSGALLETPLYNFPILIRLSSDNFSFDEASLDGSDFRLTDAYNNDIPFEITQWNAAIEKAVIWAVIDTVFPDRKNALKIYWGNKSAASQSSGETVFDTAAEFQGVWHLEEETDDTVSDATANTYDGVRVNEASVLFTEGVAGSGCEFNGTDGYIQMYETAESGISFPEQGQYTVSAWVYIEEADDNSHVILSKGNYQYFLFYTSIHTNSPLWEFSEYQSGIGWDLSTSRTVGGAWHYLTGVRNGTEQYLYVDGIVSDSTNFIFSATKGNDTSFDLTLGRFLQDFGGNNFCFFKGIIDEVMISSTVRSSEWIRMCYENQRPENNLITFTEPDR